MQGREVLEALASWREEARLSARQTLEAKGIAILPFLSAWLEGEEEGDRSLAMKALGYEGGEEAYALLLEQCDALASPHRFDALLALARMMEAREKLQTWLVFSEGLSAFAAWNVRKGEVLALFEETFSQAGHERERRMILEAVVSLEAPEALALYRRALADPHPFVRERAAWALGRLGAREGIAYLERALGDTSRDVRYWAITGLKMMGGEKAEEALLQALDDPTESHRLEVLSYLGLQGCALLLPRLGAFLSGGEGADLFCAALQALERLSPSEAVEVARGCLEAEESAVREEAMSIWGEHGGERALPDVLRWSRATEESMRWIGVKSLQYHRCEESIARLIELLGEGDEGVRTMAAYSLGAWKIEEAIPLMLAQLTTPMLPMSLDDEEGRVIFVEALARMEVSERVVCGLLPLLEEQDRDLLCCVIGVVGEKGIKEAIPSLVRQIHHPSREVRLAVVWALGELGEVEVSSLLCEALKDVEEGVREAAARSLGKLRAVEEIGTLQRSLEDPCVSVGSAAAWSFLAMGVLSPWGALKLLGGWEAEIREWGRYGRLSFPFEQVPSWVEGCAALQAQISAMWYGVEHGGGEEEKREGEHTEKRAVWEVWQREVQPQFALFAERLGVLRSLWQSWSEGNPKAQEGVEKTADLADALEALLWVFARERLRRMAEEGEDAFFA
jgi:HEAT repeat protein